MRPVTLDADKGYDTQDVVTAFRGLNVTPHIVQAPASRKSAVNEGTTRHAGYALGQRRRKRAGETFGCLKAVGRMCKTRHRLLRRVGGMLKFAVAAHNLVGISNLAVAAA
ncbi:MAG: hypothetical protein ACE5JS_09390 [Nitrospinota bacterium]